jgi:hypothetical protein
MPLRAAKAAEQHDHRGWIGAPGPNAPKRQMIVRGLRIACRTISVSLKDAGPQGRLDRKRRVTS